MTYPSGKLAFNPSIQGLRAIAILLVLAAHTNVPFLHGGFIGVDVFFVISGYLITGLLVTEINNTGTLNLSRFYARRLKRLLPALLVMLGAASAAIYIFTPTTEHPAQASAAASAAAWVSNFYFIFAEQNYFESTSLVNAFLHTWSLGVEEQFYLIWPLLIVFACGLSSKHRLVLLSAITLFSFALCMWLASSHPTQAFYLMPSRIWQFGAGAVVWHLAGQFSEISARAKAIQLLTGTTLIVASALWIGEGTRYPDWVSLLPTLGAAACLFGISTTSDSVSSGPLARGPLKYIGDISYSLYLWHWPVLVVGQHLLLDKGLYSQLLLVATSFALADLSYRLIENPIRQHQAARISTKWQIVISLAAIALVNVQLIKWHNSATDRLVAQAESPFALARMDAPEIYRHGCDDWYSSAQVKVCHFGAKDAPKVAVIWGDSIGLQWFPAIKGALELEYGQWRIEVITKSSCPIVDHPFFYERLGRIYTECSDWRRDAAKYINKLTPDLLVVGSAGSYRFDAVIWEQGTRKLLGKNVMSARQIAILAPTYSLGINGVTCLEQQAMRPNEEDGCHSRTDEPYRSSAIAALNKAANSLPHAQLIDLNDEVCPNKICRPLLDNTIVYRDNQHITATFAEKLSSVMKAKLQLRSETAPYQ